MSKTFKRINNWIGFILLIGAISYYLLAVLFNIYIFDSPYLFAYGLIILGLAFSIIGREYLKAQAKNSATKIIGKIGLYGNSIIAILFFPPFAFIWVTFIFGH